MSQVIDLTGPDSSYAASQRAHPAAVKRSAPISLNRIQTQSLPHKISRQSLMVSSQSTPILSNQPKPPVQSNSAGPITIHYKDRIEPRERVSSTDSDILTEESEIEISDDESARAIGQHAPILPSNQSPIPPVSPTPFQPIVFPSLGNSAPQIPIMNKCTTPLSTGSSDLISTFAPARVTAPPSSDSASADFDTESWPLFEENFGQWGGAKIRKAKFDATECREAFAHAITCMSYRPTEEIGDLREILLGFREVLHRELPQLIQRHPGLKVGISVKNIYEYTPNGIETELDINVPMHFIQSPVGLDDLIIKAELFIQDRNATFIQRGSSLAYVRTDSIQLKVLEWDIRAAHGWRQLPSGLINKIKSILNIENKDNRCLAYCLAAYLLRREAAARRRASALLRAPEADPNIPHPLPVAETEPCATTTTAEHVSDHNVEFPFPPEHELLSTVETNEPTTNNLSAILLGSHQDLPQKQPELGCEQQPNSIPSTSQSLATQILQTIECVHEPSSTNPQSDVYPSEPSIPTLEPTLPLASLPTDLPPNDVLSPATIARLLDIMRAGKSVSDAIPTRGKTARKRNELEEEENADDLVEEDDLLGNDGVQYAPSDACNPFDSDKPINLKRANQYKPHFERFGLNQLEYPVNPTSMGDIEDTLKLKINVFSFFDEDGYGRFPLHISDKPYNREVDLLYWDEHFALITSFSGFLRDLSKFDHKLYI